MANRIKKAFNKAAASYDDYCHLQLQTGRQLVAFVKQYHCDSSRIVDLGCGTGMTTKELASAIPYHEFYAIDVADQLLTKARARLQNSSINIAQADFDQALALGQFNIIFSNMALHWCQDFATTLKHIFHSLAEDGILAFSIPLYGTFAEIKEYCTVNDFLENFVITDLLKATGYDIVQMQMESTTFEFTHLLQALKSIKKIGANHVKNRDNLNLAKMRLAVQSTEKVMLTYKIGYFIAKIT